MSRRKVHGKMHVTSHERIGVFKKESERSMFRPLAFDCCALSLQPFRTPMLSPSGGVFDLLSIVPFVKKHGVDPIDGSPLKTSQLVRLTFHKDPEGRYWCPVMRRVFTEFSKIVAVRTSGHVYSWEAVEELNIKAGNWKCLQSGTPFARSDLVVLQDPGERRNVQSFHYVRVGLDKGEAQEEASIRADPSMRRVLAQLQEKEKEARKVKRRRREEVAAKPQPKQTSLTGAVKVYTSLGALSLELWCHSAPLACENFLLLCERGYYSGTKFHRLIPHFMIQGGDPTGTGTGGESAFGQPFDDEIDPKLHHNKRGLLSMANSGPGTNNSQFFILFEPHMHLDSKHTIFGRVTGGLEVLDAMEKIPTNNADLPLVDVCITDTVVLVNPFSPESLAQEARKREDAERAEKKQQIAKMRKGQWFSDPSAAFDKPEVQREGVGKYLKKGKRDSSAAPALSFASAAASSAGKRKKRPKDFGAAF